MSQVVSSSQYVLADIFCSLFLEAIFHLQEELHRIPFHLEVENLQIGKKHYSRISLYSMVDFVISISDEKKQNKSPPKTSPVIQRLQNPTCLSASQKLKLNVP